ncbi:MAG: SDR family oxidoreductase, partial [Elusimicrobia bacterium]|nr:SDR family oxidoreductase [Elusimicrobiota bacterium]
IATTRFPQDAAARYSREPDFAAWKGRLSVHGLDLRHSPSVELFARRIAQTESRLDILINNAAQTVRRPAAFYEHLREIESLEPRELPGGAGELLAGPVERKALLAAGAGGDAETESQPRSRLEPLGALAPAALFPDGRLDADLQQLDLRAVNSWRLRLAEVSTRELLEVQLVNAVAPFILCGKLKALMLRHANGEQHVVNASAMEGVFSRHTKTDKHPHTNMAKAALNMLTLTSAPDYHAGGIQMNAVDTGWVTDEDPLVHSLRKQAVHDFQPPLDVVDGAARILDPLFVGLNTGEHSSGKFFKDYKPAAW